MIGAWGLVIMFKDRSNTLYCSRQGSPILVSQSSHMIAIASEQSALMGMMNNYIVLSNGDICEASIDMSSAILMSQLETIQVTSCTRDVQSSIGSFPHWTAKEIHDQRTTISATTNFGGENKKTASNLVDWMLTLST